MAPISKARLSPQISSATPLEGGPAKPKIKIDPKIWGKLEGSQAQTASTFESKAVNKVEVPTWDATDYSLPLLDTVFEHATKFPGKTIFLDTKLPNGKPEVAKRMAQQYMEAFRKFPAMKEQAFVSIPNEEMLNVVKEEFAKTPGFENFKNFCFDHEELNKSKGDVKADADPLRGSGDNHFIAVGDPKAPLKKGDFDDLKTVVADALAKTRDPKDPNFGKQLCVWTINDESKMKELAALKPDFILTDNPEGLKTVLDGMFSANDPARPKIMCHRGGPAGFAPMNTMPMIDEGFRKGDAIEIDICSAKDGAILFHDNSPMNVVTNLHNQGIDEPGFRTLMPNIGTGARTKRLDEQTTDQIRGAYSYKKTKKSGANVGRVAGTVGGWAATNTQKGVQGVGKFFKKLFK